MAEPNSDFTFEEYYKIRLENLMQSLQAGEIEWEDYNRKSAEIVSNFNRGAPLESFEFYREALAAWASRLPFTMGNKWHVAPSGKLYSSEGVALNDASTKKEYSDYFAEPSTAMDAYETQRVAIDWANYQRAQAADAESRRRWEAEQAFQSNESAASNLLRQQTLDLQNRQLQSQQLQSQQQAQQSQRELQLEREKYLADLNSSPQNWIQAWMFENAPRVAEQQGRQQEWIRARRDLDDVQERVGEQRSTFLNRFDSSYGSLPGINQPSQAGIKNIAYGPGTGPTSNEPDVVLAARALLEWQNEENKMRQLSAQPKPTVQSTPNAPEWLPAFVPGLTAGEPITKERARVASGQQWMATPWSQRQMLGGYLQYASPKGIPTLTDYEQIVESMLPQRAEKTPRWIPARQW